MFYEHKNSKLNLFLKEQNLGCYSTPLHRVLSVLLAAPPLAPRRSVACMASSYSHCSSRRSLRRSRSCSPQHSPAMQIASDSLLEFVTDSIASQEVPDSASRKKEKKSTSDENIRWNSQNSAKKHLGSRGVEPCAPASHLKMPAGLWSFSKGMHVTLYLLGANRKNFTLINHSLVC